MILQALKEYYDRKAADPEARMAPPGFEWKEIPFIIVLKQDGTPVSIEPTHEGRRAKSFMMPQGIKKTSGIAANLLWDNVEYVLGIKVKNDTSRVTEQHAAFKAKIQELKDYPDEGLAAVNAFLAKDNKEDFLKNFGDHWSEILDGGANITFKLAGDQTVVAARPKVITAIKKMSAEQGDVVDQSICLVSGQNEVTERLHNPIKGVYGAQTSGANIVSFNLDAFKSFGKSQGANAPVGKTAAFAYTTALNHLLGRESRQRMLVGDATTVFWSQKENDLERKIADFFAEPRKEDPDRGVREVEGLYRSIENGLLVSDESRNNRFYVLGLSPNASRIAVRFWIVDTVAGIAVKIKRHFDDLKIVHGPKDKEVLSLYRLLVNTAAQGKADNIPPNLAGETMRAILENLPYPQTLLQAALRRIRAEHDITHPRAALIKACINRSTRFKNPNIEEELKMSLDESNTNIGYRLGRLFAVLEKIQQEANPGINATIRDRFYGAASGTPVAVFGNLMRLKNHHLAKLASTGRRIYFEKLLGGIIDGVEAKVAFPPHLSLEEQGRFAIGYYHQHQDFFTKK
jgi:CRISPR-associated protein Csd1